MKVSPNANNSEEEPRTKENVKFQVSENDDRLENGPIEDRSCTDIFCCLLFIAFWVGLVIIAITAYTNGLPRVKYISALYDSDRKGCGIEGEVTDSNNVTTKYDNTAYPYLYFPKPVLNLLATPRICVKSCPVYDTNGALPTTLECQANSQIKTCTSTLSMASVSTLTNTDSIINNMFLIYNTTVYLERLCFPSDAEFWKCANCTSMFSSFMSQADRFEDYVADMKLTWPLLFAVGGIAFVIGFVFMIVMRYLSGIITWLMIIAFVVALAVLGWLCYDKYKKLDAELSATGATTTTQDSSSSTDNRKILYGFALFFWIADAIALIVLCCIYHKINLAIAVLKAGADYMKQTPSALLVPPIIILLLVAFFAYWFAAFIGLFAAGAGFGDSSLPFASVSWDKPTKYMILYHGFGFLWNLAFFMAFSQFVLASSTAIWYYAQGPDSQGAHRPVSRSFYRGIRYHLGSIAFGAILVAIVQTVRLIMLYIHKQLKDAGITEGNKFIEYAMRCVHCLLECFERFIKFINKNAYIQIAIRGTNFCQAARDAFFMIWKNPVRFSIMAGLGTIFLFVGQLFITFVTLAIGYALVTNVYKNKLSSPVLPCVFYFLISYVVSIMFMNIYGMACDTILQCFCCDEELQKAKGRDPKHCPEPLRDLFDKIEKKK